MSQLLADPDDIATYVQDYSLNEDALEQALGFATAMVQAETAQTLFLVENDVATLPWNNTGTIDLPERPVQSVSAVEFRAPFNNAVYTLPVGTWSLAGPGGRLWVSGPWDLPGPIYWGASLMVTYSHGFAAIPPDLKAVVIGLAVRTLHKPSEALNTSLDSYSKPTSSAGPGMLSDAERAICRRYRRSTAGMSGTGPANGRWRW